MDGLVKHKNEQLLSGEKTYARSMLKLVKKCDLAGTSGCVLSCENNTDIERWISRTKDVLPHFMTRKIQIQNALVLNGGLQRYKTSHENPE